MTNPPEYFKKNFDYGENVFSNMDKFKSIKEFTNKKRKKRVKLRKAALLSIALDFSLKDDTTINDPESTVNTPGEFNDPYGNYGDVGVYHSSNPAGGMTDTLHTLQDEDGKGWYDLDIGKLEDQKTPIPFDEKLEKWLSMVDSGKLYGINSDLEREDGPMQEKNTYYKEKKN